VKKIQFHDMRTCPVGIAIVQDNWTSYCWKWLFRISQKSQKHP